MCLPLKIVLSASGYAPGATWGKRRKNLPRVTFQCTSPAYGTLCAFRVQAFRPFSYSAFGILQSKEFTLLNHSGHFHNSITSRVVKQATQI